MDPLLSTNSSNDDDNLDKVQPQQKKIKLLTADDEEEDEVQIAIKDMKDAILDYLYVNDDGYRVSGDEEINGLPIYKYHQQCVEKLQMVTKELEWPIKEFFIYRTLFQDTIDLFKLMKGDDYPSSFAKRQRLVTVLTEILPEADDDDDYSDWDYRETDWDDRYDMVIRFLLDDFILQNHKSDDLVVQGTKLVTQVIDVLYTKSNNDRLIGVDDVLHWMDVNRENADALAAGLMILCSCPLCLRDEAEEGLNNYVSPVIDIVMQGSGLLKMRG